MLQDVGFTVDVQMVEVAVDGHARDGKAVGQRVQLDRAMGGQQIASIGKIIQGGESICAEAGIPLTLRMQEGYDHGYYFVGSFIGDHLRWHAERLKR